MRLKLSMASAAALLIAAPLVLQASAEAQTTGAEVDKLDGK